MENDTKNESDSQSDPERLALIRSQLEVHSTGTPAAQYFVGTMAELLADRDHWEAEAKRYRSRCPVEASDVEAAGVDWMAASDWFAAQAEAEREGDWSPWSRIADFCEDHMWHHYMLGTYRVEKHVDGVVRLINELGRDNGTKCAFDILDEMATAPGASAEKCPACNGDGADLSWDRTTNEVAPSGDCPTCEGTGRVSAEGADQ